MRKARAFIYNRSSMINLVPLSQRDPAWRQNRLGYGDATTTIGSDGCLITSLAMLSGAFGLTETPALLNDKLRALGAGRGFAGALFVWSAMPDTLPGMSARRRIDCRSIPAPLGEIDAEVAAGRPVLVELDMSPSPELDSHWVVLTEKRDGDYAISDPWPVEARTGTSLVAAYGFGRRGPERIITYVVEIDGPRLSGGLSGDSADPAVRVVVADDPDVRAIGGLRLREAPVSGRQKKLLPIGSPLMALEPPDAAAAKVGQAGAWLHAATDDGLTGFVAAWYVVRAQVERGIGPGPDLSAAPALQRAAGLQVSVGSRGAVLRRTPSGSAIAGLGSKDRLRIIEAPKSALAAIGHRGEWIAVRVMSGPNRGRKGFVSAGALHLR